MNETSTSSRRGSIVDALLNYLLLQPPALRLEFEDQRVVILWEMATSALPLQRNENGWSSINRPLCVPLHSKSMQEPLFQLWKIHTRRVDQERFRVVHFYWQFSDGLVHEIWVPRSCIRGF